METNKFLDAVQEILKKNKKQLPCPRVVCLELEKMYTASGVYTLKEPKIESSKPTKSEIDSYIMAVDKYKNDLKKYEEEKREYYKQRHQCDDAVYFYCHQYYEVDKYVPKKYQAKLKNYVSFEKTYDSYGEMLEGLITIFK